jgi:hypothetical protein
MSEPQIGRNVYNAELARIKLANATFHRCLTQLLEDPGPQTRQVLVTKMALALVDSEKATTELESIGRQAKTERTA